MHINITHSKIGKINWKRVLFWLRMNESYLFDQRTKRQPALRIYKFLAVYRQYSHVSIALIGIGLFEMSLNAIVNRLSVLSYDTVRLQPKTSRSEAVALSAEPVGRVLVLLNARWVC